MLIFPYHSTGVSLVAAFPYSSSAVTLIRISCPSAHNPELFFEDYSDVGFDELITKPYSVEKIKEKIRDFNF